MKNTKNSHIYPTGLVERIRGKLLLLGNPKIRRKKYSKNKYVKDLQQRMDAEYISLKKDPIAYLNVQFSTTILLFFLVLSISKTGYIYAPIVAILYYYLFYYFTIDRPIKQRVKKLDYEALQFFEILTLTLESGRNLERALSIAVLNVDSEISAEFKKSLLEVKYGKSLIEAIEDMKKRIPSETVNNILLNITQTSVFGNSILDTMYHQVDFLREKQILEIKEQINKIPNKISIISVLFIVPLILLLILGPFVIQYLG